MVEFQVNNTKTILRCPEKKDETIKKEFVMEKAHQLDALKKLLKTDIIKRTTFNSEKGLGATLTIVTESQKKKAKRESRKNYVDEVVVI